VRTVTIDDLIRSIDEAARHEPGGALAFDGDGTLWSGDIGDDYFVALLEDGLLEPARSALEREAIAENIDVSGTSRDIAHRIHLAYHAGSFPEERVCEIMAWAAAGRSRSDLDVFCARVIESVGLRERLHAETIRVVEHARRVGIEVFLVSASPRAIVEQAAKVVGIALANTVAVREAYDAAGVVQCAVERPIPYGDGKVKRLRERIGPTRTLYAAFGDNAFDVSMLREARHPIAIRPKPRLVERAGEIPSLLVLDRA
jgi:phosphatidylglycerophosphatase C